jgi:hypothetical protein
MNTIEIRNQMISLGYETHVFFIDGKPLYEYFYEWSDSNLSLFESLNPVDVFEIAWTDEYDFEADALFMRFVLGQENAITPILLCPDDFDFSCVVIVADVIKQNDKVIWKRIGKVDHSGESYKEEERYGVLFTEAYSEEDWERYGDNIALEKIDSPAWCDWIAKNWSDEMYRRSVNYTYPYYQNEHNIEWFSDCYFEFDRDEYEALIKKCYPG